MRLPFCGPALVLAIWAGCAALTGCATLPPPPPGAAIRGAVADSPLESWLNDAPRHRNLEGVAKARVQAGGRTVSGTQVIVAAIPDCLRTETLSPFGTPLLLLAADGAQLNVSLPGENRFYQGRATPENLGRFTRIPLRLPELIGILLLRPPLIAYRETQAWLLPDGGWEVELGAPPRRQFLLFDAARRLTGVRYQYGDELLLRLAYRGFRSERPDLPWQIELELPQQQIRVNLEYAELDFDRELKPGVFALSPPEGALVVPLEELPESVEQSGGVAESPDMPGGKAEQ